MFKNNKMLVAGIIIMLAVLIGLGFYLYSVYFPAVVINNLNGVIKSINGNSITVMASVPESPSLFSGNDLLNYIEKEYLLKIGSDSSIFENEVKMDGNYLTQLDSAADIKANSVISAVVKENILKNDELNVVELTIVK